MPAAVLIVLLSFETHEKVELGNSTTTRKYLLTECKCAFDMTFMSCCDKYPPENVIIIQRDTRSVKLAAR